jgi:hypothetical protein
LCGYAAYAIAENDLINPKYQRFHALHFNTSNILEPLLLQTRSLQRLKTLNIRPSTSRPSTFTPVKVCPLVHKCHPCPLWMIAPSLLHGDQGCECTVFGCTRPPASAIMTCWRRKKIQGPLSDILKMVEGEFFGATRHFSCRTVLADRVKR